MYAYSAKLLAINRETNESRDNSEKESNRAIKRMEFLCNLDPFRFFRVLKLSRDKARFIRG